jgi:4-alpha-glucanotransferase
LFDIERSGELIRVSGVLKGAKSHFGRQIWGHPLYKWQDKSLVSGLYKLFEIRVRYLASLYNYVRFDHAKGLFAYGVIDLIDHKRDTYLVGPGRPILEKIIKFARSKKLKIYAEDTGDKLKDLRSCLHIHHLPGVKVFRFAYNEKRRVFTDQYLHISSYPKNTVAYTTTHDTEPLRSYLEKLSTAELTVLTKKLHLKNPLTIVNLAKIIRDKVIKSPAKIVLIPLQDWLLTTDRINTPGTEKVKNDQNWGYKMTVAIEDLLVNF